MLHDYLLAVSLFAVLYRFGPLLSRLARLPSITLCLCVGAMCRGVGLFSSDAAGELMHLHQASLAVITLAAGSELDLVSLRESYHVVRSLAVSLTLTALLVVFLLGFGVMATVHPPGGNDGTLSTCAAASSLAAVVAIARSPSSAIGVVSELSADGPFTQTVLSVTMVTDIIVVVLSPNPYSSPNPDPDPSPYQVTDIIVVVLFTAAIEVVDAVLPSPPAAAAATSGPSLTSSGVVVRFCGRTVVHLGLSLALGALIALLCLLLLRLPTAARALQPAALLLTGGVAFAAERALHALLEGTRLGPFVRLEPMPNPNPDPDPQP